MRKILPALKLPLVLFIAAAAFIGCKDPEGCLMGKQAKYSMLTYRYSLRQLQVGRADVFEDMCKGEFYPSLYSNQLLGPYSFFKECERTKGKSCKVPTDQMSTFQDLNKNILSVLVFGERFCKEWMEKRTFNQETFVKMHDGMDKVDRMGTVLQKKYCSH